MLSEYQRLYGRPQKIGCLTSPHITDIRERIRLNSASITMELFAKYVIALWSDIESSYTQQNDKSVLPPIPGFPGFLTLLAFYVFMKEGVDVAVVETGIGGENDSTNAIPPPVAAGITTLGLDHTNILGEDIQSIAWHKAGIFKPGSQVFTVEQESSAMEVLRHRLAEKPGTKELVINSQDLINRYGVTVQPSSPYQKRNASLAIALTQACLSSIDPSFNMTPELVRSVEVMELPGRCEVILGKYNRWFLSIAHNEISLLATCEWLEQTLDSFK
jgi:folylpolyglutamate synthase